MQRAFEAGVPASQIFHIGTPLRTLWLKPFGSRCFGSKLKYLSSTNVDSKGVSQVRPVGRVTSVFSFPVLSSLLYQISLHNRSQSPASANPLQNALWKEGVRVGACRTSLFKRCFNIAVSDRSDIVG